MVDAFGRNINYMRISITDRCNLHCRYCMPEDFSPAPADTVLTSEEIEEICRAAAVLGISRLKVTGGEPLARKDCTHLIGRLKQIPGIEQVTLTTNGCLLRLFLPDLMESGLDAVNVSLDTLDRQRYQSITGSDCLQEVLEGIQAAREAGLKVKINSVLMPGINEDEWKTLVEYAAGLSLDIRFIEMMPIGFGTRYQAVDNRLLLQKLKEKYPDLQPDQNIHGNGPAVYYRIPGSRSCVGLISAMHDKFCSSCSRIRLTALGICKPCLCYEEGIDLKAVLREPDSADGSSERQEKIRQALLSAAEKKPAQHCFETADEITENRKMVQIGG